MGGSTQVGAEDAIGEAILIEEGLPGGPGGFLDLLFGNRHGNEPTGAASSHGLAQTAVIFGSQPLGSSIPAAVFKYQTVNDTSRRLHGPFTPGNH
jgi:hypothetical protein